MLYIKFNLSNPSKYRDFEKLYAYMDQIRQPGFRFEVEEKEYPEIDWVKMTQEEIDEAYDRFENLPTAEEKRYEEAIPEYVKKFYEAYRNFEASRYGMFGFTPIQIFNYLEFGFETALVKLQQLDERHGILEFAPYGYPFGGMDRFLMTMRAYELTPMESYNGFEVITFHWTSDFEYTVTELPEQTRIYKAKMKNLST